MQREYKTIHDWVGKVIHWESYKKFKFDYTNKWYMHNLESVLENATQISRVFWDANGSPNLEQNIRPNDSQQ